MKTLDFIQNKYKLDLSQRSPIEIPNVGRVDLADWLHELDFKIGVEVGVAQGTYLEVLAKANPQMKLYGVDPWTPHRGYRDFTNRATFSKLEKRAKERLAAYSNHEFIQKFSMEAVRDFKDNSLDFVYIDANHDFQNVTNDIVEWSKKVKPGGIISGDDYYKHKGVIFCHVYQAVNGYTDSYSIRPWFLIGTNAMIPGETRDKGRSWFWIK